jgi:hypothetical protein
MTEQENRGEYGEPWRFFEDDGGCGVSDAHGRNLAWWYDSDMGGESHENAIAKRKRIVACVNACAGIPTEWLEKYGRDAVTTNVVVLTADQKVAIERAFAGAGDAEILEVVGDPFAVEKRIQAAMTLLRDHGYLVEDGLDGQDYNI